mgnify:CR=1 FL=1
MRKRFAELVFDEMLHNENIVVITADLGYKMWDRVREIFPARFFNCGAAEQLAMGMAVGMAQEGKLPVVYSITPFLLYRPFEIIRNYINWEKTKVILAGSGRDNDYSHDGHSHSASDDTRIVEASFWNMAIRKPIDELSLEETWQHSLTDPRPYYINLKR